MRNHTFEEEIETVDGRKVKIGWNWIGHMLDHSGQFHVLWPQMHKTGKLLKKKLGEKKNCWKKIGGKVLV